MSIIARVKQLDLPLDQLVVIAGGVLDGLGLRPAGDVDLVVSAELFADMIRSEKWQVGTKHDELILTHGDTEVFLSWGSDGKPNFRALYDEAITVDGVRLAHPRVVIAWKQQRLGDKDKTDIALLEEYVAHG